MSFTMSSEENIKRREKRRRRVNGHKTCLGTQHFGKQETLKIKFEQESKIETVPQSLDNGLLLDRATQWHICTCETQVSLKTCL